MIFQHLNPSGSVVLTGPHFRWWLRVDLSQVNVRFHSQKFIIQATRGTPSRWSLKYKSHAWFDIQSEDNLIGHQLFRNFEDFLFDLNEWDNVNYDKKLRADNIVHIIAHAITTYLRTQTVEDKTINLGWATPYSCSPRRRRNDLRQNSLLTFEVTISENLIIENRR